MACFLCRAPAAIREEFLAESPGAGCDDCNPIPTVA